MFKSVIPALLAAALTACGGGGGASPQTSAASVSGIFAAVTGTVSFQYYRDGSTNNPVSFIHPRDINGDGMDEIFFVAFETQPNTPAEYSNTSVHILGWENGVFLEITSRWLPGTSNQVEGVGDVCFGDFNGDGKVDVFLSAYTDMSNPVHPYALINTGTSFTKVPLSEKISQHGVTCGDINSDGYTDVFVTGYANSPQYIGSPTGLIEYQGGITGSGIAIGDFLGQGTPQVVVTDRGSAPNDIKIFSVTLDAASRTVTFTEQTTLPSVAIDQNLGVPNAGHEVRTRAVDFDADGQIDIVVFSYRYGADSVSDGVYRSEIQFFKNNNGTFVDVTDSLRVGYDTTGMTGYFPQIRDFNGDGRLDIFASQPDWYSFGHRGTSLLLQNSQGKFVDTAKTDLNRIVESGGGQATVAQGPGGTFYLIKESAWQRDGWTRVSAQPIQFR